MELALIIYFLQVVTVSNPLWLLAVAAFFVLIYYAPFLCGLYKKNKPNFPINRKKLMLEFLGCKDHTLIMDCSLGDKGDKVCVSNSWSDGDCSLTNKSAKSGIGSYIGISSRNAVKLFEAAGYTDEDIGLNLKTPEPKKVKGNKLALALSIIIAFYAIVTPDRETATHMVAAYVVQYVVTNDNVHEFAGNSYKVVEKFMGDYLSEVPEVVNESAKTVAKSVEKSVEVVKQATEGTVEEGTVVIPVPEISKQEINDTVQNIGDVMVNAAETYKKVEKVLQ